MYVGLGLPFEQDKLTTAYSPTNFIFTNTYGSFSFKHYINRKVLYWWWSSIKCII